MKRRPSRPGERENISLKIRAIGTIEGLYKYTDSLAVYSLSIFCILYFTRLVHPAAR